MAFPFAFETVCNASVTGADFIGRMRLEAVADVARNRLALQRRRKARRAVRHKQAAGLEFD